MEIHFQPFPESQMSTIVVPVVIPLPLSMANESDLARCTDNGMPESSESVEGITREASVVIVELNSMAIGWWWNLAFADQIAVACVNISRIRYAICL